MVARAAIANAEPEPPATPAPRDSSWYATTQPVSAPTTPGRIRHTVLRGGTYVLGGVSYVDAIGYGRFDVGVPTPLRRLPRLRSMLVTELSIGTDADSTARRYVVLTPTVQTDWHLPFDTKRSEVVVILAAGLRRNQLWVKKPEEPFWPSTWETTTAYAFKLTAGVEYRAFSGLVLSAQPSVGFPINTPEPPDAG
jgi:hypothetical protein